MRQDIEQVLAILLLAAAFFVMLGTEEQPIGNWAERADSTHPLLVAR